MGPKKSTVQKSAGAFVAGAVGAGTPSISYEFNKKEKKKDRTYG